MVDSKLADAIIKLHDIARLVACEVGEGQLSEDIRKCADRLNTLTKPVSETLKGQ